MKQCSKCKVTQPIEQFSKRSGASDGLKSQCKACDRAHRQANAVAIAEKGREYRLANKDHKLAADCAYREKNREARRDSHRAYLEANRVKRRAYNHHYRMTQQDRLRGLAQRRRTQQLEQGSFLVTQRELRRLYSSPCLYCGATKNIQADHVIPISRGGRHSIGNLVPACQPCNLSKHARTIMEWRQGKRERAVRD